MKKLIALSLTIAAVATASFLFMSGQSTNVPQDTAQLHSLKPMAIMGDNEISEYGSATKNNQQTNHQEFGSGRSIASKIEESHKAGGPLGEWLDSLKTTDFRFQTTEDGRKILTVLGGNFKGVGENEESAFNFLTQFASKIGVDASQIDKDSLFRHKTIRKQVYGFEQVFKGLPVFDSFVKVETKRDDKSAYMILNNLKIIPQSTDVPDVAVGLEKAKVNALATLSEKFNRATPTDEPLVVYARTGETIDLAWSLLLQGDHISEFVLVSATTGEVLANYSAQSHQEY